MRPFQIRNQVTSHSGTRLNQALPDPTFINETYPLIGLFDKITLSG